MREGTASWRCATGDDGFRHGLYALSWAGSVLAPSFRQCGQAVAVVEVGQSIQAAVDGCPEGGFVLFAPGIHEGPVLLAKEVHVFGAWRATLRYGGERNDVATVASTAARATVTGVRIERLAL